MSSTEALLSRPAHPGVLPPQSEVRGQMASHARRSAPVAGKVKAAFDEALFSQNVPTPGGRTLALLHSVHGNPLAG